MTAFEQWWAERSRGDFDSVEEFAEAAFKFGLEHAAKICDKRAQHCQSKEGDSFMLIAAKAIRKEIK